MELEPCPVCGEGQTNVARHFFLAHLEPYSNPTFSNAWYVRCPCMIDYRKDDIGCDDFERHVAMHGGLHAHLLSVGLGTFKHAYE